MSKKNNVDVVITVTPVDAAKLLFHHLSLAAVLFEAGPSTMAELMGLFNAEYPDSEILGVRSKKLFIESLNSEYVEAFDDEAEAQGNSEGE